MEQRLALIALEVERDALLVQVKRLEIRAVIICQQNRPGLTGRVTTGFAAFYLYNFCAQVSQVHGAIRPGAKLFNGQYANALQG